MIGIFRIVIATLLLSSISMAAQIPRCEYLVKVDPATGNYSIVNRIPGVAWVTTGLPAVIDEFHHRYHFIGSDSSLDDRLYCVSTISGEIISRPAINRRDRASAAGFLMGMTCDNSTGTLYGVLWVAPEKTSYLVVVDPSTASYSKVAPIPEIVELVYSDATLAFNENGHRVMFTGTAQTGADYFIVMDVLSGAVVVDALLSKTDYSAYLIDLQFDNATNTLYAGRGGDPRNMPFVTVDVSSGANTIIGSFGVAPALFIGAGSTFDEQQHRYVRVGGVNPSYLFTMDATTGSILSQPAFPFPAVIDPDNILYFQYENSSGTLFALHWGPVAELPADEELCPPGLPTLVMGEHWNFPISLSADLINADSIAFLVRYDPANCMLVDVHAFVCACTWRQIETGVIRIVLTNCNQPVRAGMLCSVEFQNYVTAGSDTAYTTISIDSAAFFPAGIALATACTVPITIVAPCGLHAMTYVGTATLSDAYPNPASTFSTVRVSCSPRERDNTRLRLFNSYGELVMDLTDRMLAASDISFAVTEFPAGLYWCVLEGSGERTKRALFVVR